MEDINLTGEEKLTGEPTLEEMFSDLETVIGKMEGTDITLERSFELYNQGMELLKKCNKAIDAVEKKVLVLDEDGEKHEF